MAPSPSTTLPRLPLRKLKLQRPAVKKAIQRPEQAFHKQVADLLWKILPTHVIWFHVPNGGWRSGIEGAIMKGLGGKPGVSDLALFWRDTRGHNRVGWIELKSPDGEMTATQREFQAQARLIGHHTGVARCIDDIYLLLDGWACPHKRGVY